MPPRRFAPKATDSPPSRTARGRAALPPLLLLILVALVAVTSSLLVSGVPRLEPPRKLPALDRSRDPTLHEPRSLSASSAIAAQRQLEDALDRPVDGSARLELSFIDGAESRPLADLLFMVYREQGEALVLARGASDERGMATLVDLPEGELVVATQRRPPHAAELGVVTLRAGSTSRLTLAHGGGSRARGRVVDDLGRPLAGLDLCFDPRPGPLELADLAAVQPLADGLAPRFAIDSEALARTDAHGEYVANEVAPRPQLWRVPGGVIGVERLGALVLSVSDGDQYDEQPVTFVEGADGEVADLVLPRPVAFGGFVVDAAQQPVAGALVTASAERALQTTLTRPLGADAVRDESGVNVAAALPGEADFECRRSEMLTLASGRFELAPVAASCGELFVILPDGAVHSFLVPALPPGEKRRDLRLELRRRTELFLELREPDGTLLDGDDEAGGSELPIRLLRHDGSALVAAALPLATPGRYALSSELPLEQLRAIQVEPRDGRPSLQRFAQPLEARATVVFTIERPQRLRLMLTLPAGSVAPRTATLRVHACLASAARRAESGVDCCGFGGTALAWFNDDDDAAAAAPRCEVELPVARAAPFWIDVIGPFAAGGGEASLEFGPFLPGDVAHAIDLPALHDKSEDAGDRELQRLLPTRPLEAQIVDERDGTPLDGAVFETWIEPTIGTRPHACNLGWSSAADGRLFDYVAPEATHGRVRAPRFIDSAAFALPHGNAAVDLGSIALQPQPIWRLRLLDAGGKALRNAPPLRVTALPIDARHEGGGMVALYGEVPDHFVLEIGAAASAAEFGTALERRVELPLTRWPASTAPTVTLPSLREVIVEVALAAVATSQRSANFAVTVAPDGDARGVVTCRGGTERDSADPLRRRFAFLLPPGHYVASGRSLLLDVAEQPFEVVADGSMAAIVLTAR